MNDSENRIPLHFTKPFRAQKRPYVVDVWEVTKFNKMPEWAAHFCAFDEDQLVVCTLEGVMKCKIGDFLIKGIVDEVYPCRRDIFLDTYEVVLDDE